jgi:peptide/bleomycin uptake transporter
MFRSFFLNKKWLHWSALGSAMILYVTWYKVQIDVQINEWFGEFYDTIQKALAEPGAVSLETYLDFCWAFAELAGLYIFIAVTLDFYVRHFVFRWRIAMNDFYIRHWNELRHIEGAAQRVQEDTMRFANILERLGVAFMRSLMTLVAFIPILHELSAHVTELPWIGPVEHSMIFIALLSAACGTVLLAAVGVKLPGLEFNNQRVEAAYRKELVYGEDDAERANVELVGNLFEDIRKNYFRLYLHYLYFDVAKWSYLQFSVILPYIALGPTVIAGVITLGVFQRIAQVFNRVEGSLQFLVNSWGTIVELISIYKRLRAFEAVIRDPNAPAPLART